MHGPVIFCNDLLKNQHPISSSIKRVNFKIGSPSTIVSFEDLLSKDFRLDFDYSWCNNSVKKFNVLILRDPFNLFASRYVWQCSKGEAFRNDLTYRKRVIKNWKDNAAIFLQWKNELASTPSAADNVAGIPLNYNRWCTSSKYKLQLQNVLELRNDQKINTKDIQNFGGGSSFATEKSSEDKNEFLTRFLSLQNNQDFKEIFNDGELWDLSKEIFGEIKKSKLLMEC